jgi:hypothetical protein
MVVAPFFICFLCVLYGALSLRRERQVRGLMRTLVAAHKSHTEANEHIIKSLEEMIEIYRHRVMKLEAEIKALKSSQGYMV